MAEKSFPWTANATGDGTSGGYTGLEWGEMWRRLFNRGNEASAGVVRGHGNELAVSGTSSPVAVATGAGMVYGKHYYNDASLNLTVTTPVVGTTGGHVILRLDWTAQTVRAVAVRNTDGVNSTPSLTQSTSTQWEVRLASFTITTGGVIALTDTRAFLSPKWDAANNRLGIGTTSPAEIVHAAKSSTGATGIEVENTNTGSSAYAVARFTTNSDRAAGLLRNTTANTAYGGAGSLNLWTGIATALGFVTNDVLRMIITAAGRVGIGTSSPGAELEVSGNIMLDGASVPNVYRRKGGSATNWSTAGTNDYTPIADVRMEVGVSDVTVGVGANSGFTALTFPAAFGNVPLVLVTINNSSPSGPATMTASARNLTASGCDLYIDRTGNGAGNTVTVSWIAIGPG